MPPPPVVPVVAVVDPVVVPVVVPELVVLGTVSRLAMLKAVTFVSTFWKPFAAFVVSVLDPPLKVLIRPASWPLVSEIEMSPVRRLTLPVPVPSLVPKMGTLAAAVVVAESISPNGVQESCWNSTKTGMFVP